MNKQSTQNTNWFYTTVHLVCRQMQISRGSVLELGAATGLGRFHVPESMSYQGVERSKGLITKSRERGVGLIHANWTKGEGVFGTHDVVICRDLTKGHSTAGTIQLLLRHVYPTGGVLFIGTPMEGTLTAKRLDGTLRKYVKELLLYKNPGESYLTAICRGVRDEWLEESAVA